MKKLLTLLFLASISTSIYSQDVDKEEQAIRDYRNTPEYFRKMEVCANQTLTNIMNNPETKKMFSQLTPQQKQHFANELLRACDSNILRNKDKKSHE